VFLTARDAVSERVAGFEVGGDDYVTKPFALAELAERIRALLRRSASHPVLEVGGLRLDPVTHAALNGTASATLTPIEFRVLSTLLTRPGEVVRRAAPHRDDRHRPRDRLSHRPLTAADGPQASRRSRSTALTASAPSAYPR
jgi:DNA-binding response OmpR family regulator